MSLSEVMVRRFVFPLHERARGRATYRFMRCFVRQLGESAATIDALQEQRLRNLLAFCGTHIPYYQNLFVDHGVVPYAPNVWQELRKLPTLDKQTIRDHTAEMVVHDVPGGALPIVTGGTSGQTLHFFHDQRRAAATMGARLAIQMQFGVRPGDRRVYLWGSPIETQVNGIKQIRNRLINEVLLDAFDLRPALMDRHLETIRRFKPRVIYSFSSALTLLMQHAARRGWSPDEFSCLRCCVGTGEPVTPEQRAQVRAVTGAPLISEYGARESGLMAYECPLGKLHVLSPDVVIEVFRDGRPAPVGEVGEIITTQLHCRAQPLVRYAQGDLGRLTGAQCDCGWPLPVLELENTRITGLIALPDGRLCSSNLMGYIVRDHHAVHAFRVHQRSLTRFDVMLVVAPEFRAAVQAQVTQRCQRYLGPQTELSFQFVDEIPPQPSGKRSQFISDIAGDYHHFELVPVSALANDEEPSTAS